MAMNLGYVARETGQNLGRNPTLTIASVVTVGIALTLAGITLLVRQGVDDLAGRFRGDVSIVVFVEPDASQEQIDAIERSLEENPEVARAVYVDKQESFEEAQRLFEDSEVMLELLREEDLPTSFRVTPRNPDIEAVVSLRSVLERESGVREVSSADEAIRAIQQLSAKLNFGVRVAAAVSAAVAILLIYNTIRTAMFARRREIEVMKLVGATNSFIRVPFILEGMVQALLGGLLAILMMFGVNRFLFTPLAEQDGLEIFKDFSFTVGDVVSSSVWLVLAGAVIGAIGSGFAVGRFLDV
jgi:cell division transport system permease protein